MGNLFDAAPKSTGGGRPPYIGPICATCRPRELCCMPVVLESGIVGVCVGTVEMGDSSPFQSGPPASMVHSNGFRRLKQPPGR